MDVDLLWFSDCPNHEAAEAMVRAVLSERGLEVSIKRIQVEDEATGIALMFPGSPTIRINGQDIEPGWQRCEDCTPRCRLYVTPEGFRGLPPREWVEAAVERALSA